MLGDKIWQDHAPIGTKFKPSFVQVYRSPAGFPPLTLPQNVIQCSSFWGQWCLVILYIWSLKIYILVIQGTNSPLLLVISLDGVGWSKERKVAAAYLLKHTSSPMNLWKKQPIPYTSIPLHWPSQFLLHLGCWSLSIFLRAFHAPITLPNDKMQGCLSNMCHCAIGFCFHTFMVFRHCSRTLIHFIEADQLDPPGLGLSLASSTVRLKSTLSLQHYINFQQQFFEVNIPSSKPC